MTPSAIQLDLTGVDLGSVLAETVRLAGLCMGVIISFIGFRKGFSFVKKQLKGA